MPLMKQALYPQATMADYIQTLTRLAFSVFGPGSIFLPVIRKIVLDSNSFGNVVKQKKEISTYYLYSKEHKSLSTMFAAWSDQQLPFKVKSFLSVSRNRSGCPPCTNKVKLCSYFHDQALDHS